MITGLWIVAIIAVIIAGNVAYEEWKAWKDEPEKYRVVQAIRIPVQNPRRAARFQGCHRWTPMHTTR